MIKKITNRKDNNIFNIISINKVDKNFILHCPNCNNPLLIATPNTLIFPDGQDALFDDGDCISGLHDSLTFQQREPTGYTSLLMTGECSHCYKTYYSMQVTLIN